MAFLKAVTESAKKDCCTPAHIHIANTYTNNMSVRVINTSQQTI